MVNKLKITHVPRLYNTPPQKNYSTMKIIFLEAVQDYGGARISTVELAQRLVSDHMVYMVDLYGSCKPFIDVCATKDFKLKIIDKRENPFIIRSTANRLTMLLNLIKFIPHLFHINKKLNKLINEIDADYVIVNSSKVLSFLIRKRFRAQVVFFARGWFGMKQISKIDKHLYRKLVDKYVCVSEATRQALYCGGMASLENLYVVKNAIDENELREDIADIPDAEDCFKILHSGGFLPAKGQHISIEIAKRLKEEGFKFKLIITGIIYKGHVSRKYYKQIEQLIKTYGLEKHVQLVVDRSNVIDYFRACDVLIHPSDTEGLPRTVMEAMILRKPVIANAVGGVTDYILNGYTGYIPRYNCVEDYVSFIRRLATDSSLYNYIASNAYSLVKNTFTIQAQNESMNRVLL